MSRSSSRVVGRVDSGWLRDRALLFTPDHRTGGEWCDAPAWGSQVAWEAWPVDLETGLQAAAVRLHHRGGCTVRVRASRAASGSPRSVVLIGRRRADRSRGGRTERERRSPSSWSPTSALGLPVPAGGLRPRAAATFEERCRTAGRCWPLLVGQRGDLDRGRPACWRPPAWCTPSRSGHAAGADHAQRWGPCCRSCATTTCWAGRSGASSCLPARSASSCRSSAIAIFLGTTGSARRRCISLVATRAGRTAA